MLKNDRCTFEQDDVTLLLTDITGTINPKATSERETLIQSGVHYSEMLPFEYKPSEEYLSEYNYALNEFACETASAVMLVADKIYIAKKGRPVLVSLARAGTPIGILIKRYLYKKYNYSAPHYTISIVRGRGIDRNAMQHIIENHDVKSIQFIDGWTGRGAILNELSIEIADFIGKHDKRLLLAVLADPANVTEICGTHDDLPIASSFLNSTVCGLMSRTIMHPGIQNNEYHGVVFYENLRSEDKSYEFIEKIEKYFKFSESYGMDEVIKISIDFNIKDINFIKPGIGETTRVLLRRVPDVILISENALPKCISHIIKLAEEKEVPIIYYPLKQYQACGIIKTLNPDL